MNIKKIESYILSSPYGNGQVFGQPKGVKSIAIVEIHADNGLIGYGESYGGIYSPELFNTTVNLLSDRITGMSLDNRDNLMKKLHIPFVSDGGFVRSVIGAIDIAIMDILSQEQGIPLYKMLNSKNEGIISIYASGGSVVYTPEQIQNEIQDVKQLGIPYYKLRCGLQGLKKDLIRIETTIEEFDNNVMVDYIQGTLKNMDRGALLTTLKELNNYELYWIEEIIQPYNIKSLPLLKEQSHHLMAMGEHLTNYPEFRSMYPYVDIIQPDITQCGGYYYLEDIIEKLSYNGLDISIHCWGSSVSFMSNLHFATAYNTMMEYPLVSLELNKHINKQELIMKNGFLQPPTEPGLGIHISDEVKEKYKFVNNSGFKI